MAMSDLVPTSPQQTAVPVRPKAAPKSIGPKFIEMYMPWFESFWHDNKRYPSDSDIAQKFGWKPEYIGYVNSHKFWLGCLQRRGITPPNASYLNRFELSDKQVAAVAIITNFTDKRSPVARLTDIGVSELELQGWYSNPKFLSYLTARSEDALANVGPTANVELARLIQNGNFQAIKFYFEVTGKAQSPEAVNVKQALQVIIEAVQKHVKDPTVLQAIAEEVQAVRGLSAL